MQKDKQEILTEVIKLQKQLYKLEKENPQDPAIAPLKARISEKTEAEAYKVALEEEERRMGEELKKMFLA